MLTELQLFFNFNATKAKAAEIERIAGQLRKMANNDMENDKANINSNWQGESARACIKKINIMKNEVLEVADSLQRTADTIRRVASRVYQTELKNLELARNRKS